MSGSYDREIMMNHVSNTADFESAHRDNNRIENRNYDHEDTSGRYSTDETDDSDDREGSSKNNIDYRQQSYGENNPEPHHNDEDADYFHNNDGNSPENIPGNAGNNEESYLYNHLYEKDINDNYVLSPAKVFNHYVVRVVHIMLTKIATTVNEIFSLQPLFKLKQWIMRKINSLRREETSVEIFE